MLEGYGDMVNKSIRRFVRDKTGSIAIIGAAVIGIAAMFASFAVEYSQFVNVKAKIQRAADAATLVAASEFRDNKNKEAALARAENFLRKALSQVKGVEFKGSFDVAEAESDGSINAAASIDMTYKSLFRGSILGGAMRTTIDTKTSIRHTPQDLYLVLLVDSTGSMWRLIDSVRDAAGGLEKGVRDKLLEKGLKFSKFYVKVAFFGDLRLDKPPYGWRESPLYDLSKESDVRAFRHFVASTPTYYGWDLPESSLAGIAHFVTAPLPAPLKKATTVQSIVVWTDAAGVPLDHDSLEDDVTVNLYKAHGNLGRSNRYRKISGYSWYNVDFYKHYYDEEAEYDGDATGAAEDATDYGCCSSFEVLENRWKHAGAVPLDRRALGLIVPTDMEPWGAVSKWRNVTMKGYGNPDASSIVSDVVDTLNGTYSSLTVTH